MPVDTKAKAYEEAAPKWARSRDAIAGQDAVHAAGVKYLPRLSEQTPAEYDAYKQRATYFNASGRTVDGLVGMVFRKPPIVVNPTAMDAILGDVDLSGRTLSELAEETVREVVSVGRTGLLVEFPRVTEQPLSQAAASAQNMRPYASAYAAESIINWRIERINNIMQPTLIVLTETHEQTKDEYSTECIPQLRVLRLIDGVYTQEVLRKIDDEWESIEIVMPTMRGNPIPFIPFYAFGANSNDLTVQDPPLLDLFDLNLAHYRVSADYEHGCHFTGLPMLLIAGVTLKEGEKVTVGSMAAITSSDPQAHGEYIEFTGQGLGALESNLNRKEAQMAAIGARMLAPEKAGVEAADTLSMRRSGETAVLAAIANLVSQGITAMLAFMASWEGIGGEISVRLNTDYMPQGITAQELSELTKALQSGAISFDTYFDNLQRGEIIRADKTAEQEKELIADDGIPLGGADDGAG